MSQPKLYSGSTTERIDRLDDHDILDADESQVLKDTIPKNWPDHCNAWIENAIGYLPIPLGVANDIPINNQRYHLPLAIEETSVVAGLCKIGKLVGQQGSLTTEHLQTDIIGQIPFKQVAMTDSMSQAWSKEVPKWIHATNTTVLKGIHQRGGGITDIKVHLKTPFLIVHIHCNPCDAMGANLINQAAEFLKPQLESFFGQKAITAILSNLNKPRVKATITLDGLDPDHAQKIADASQWADVDPHRAATHNKGIFNGIDAMCIATGNDWRAVSAGGHAYAARDGQYRALSQWTYQNKQLQGSLTLPMGIGTVGGVTKQHPIAKLSLAMLNNPDANTLAQIMVACGLLQNLAALYALTNDGIVSGHMRLHIANMIQDFDLTNEQKNKLEQILNAKLIADGYITHSTIQQCLHEVLI